ncbi:MAG: glycosyl hydrolase family 18 protein [Lachnospiraceae bacterium]|nr:glycosyl hydrolase family 18 protein [Lachnospiraceae bacterium]
MKKLIPIVIAIVLIIGIVGVNFGKTIYDKYSYGQDRADLNEYFQIFKPSDITIILQDEMVEQKALLRNGDVYFDQDTIEELFTDRFYVDTNENLLLYTTAETTVVSELESKKYTKALEEKSEDYVISFVDGGKLYIAADYIKKVCNFSYELFKEPNRVQVYTEWGSKRVADVKNDTQVRWKAGVKSEILTDVSKGDVVELLDEIDNWTRVKTNDGFIGYLETFRLSSARVEDETPVTGALSDVFPSLTEDRKINLTWHNMEYPQDGANLRNITANAKQVNVISPTWYWFTDNDGNFESLGNQDYVDAAHNMDMEVWALISDFHYGTDIDMLEVLSYTSKRTRIINELVSDALSYGVDGINIDFEKIKSEAAPHYVQFIRELSLVCHENNLVLSVDVAPPTAYTAHYNRKAQSQFIDYLIIMGYDEHYAGSPEAGSVSSIPWMKDGIENTLKYVPANKVINAVPFYTRVWKTSGGDVSSEAVTMATSFDFISRNNITTKWDEATNQNYGEMTADGIYYQVWLEDTDSLAIRINVMSAYNLAGIASWCIGQEDASMWDLIEAYMNK